MATRPALSAPPPPLNSAEAHGYDLTHRGGMGPQLLVFRNISRDSEGFAESNSEDQRRAFEDQAALASESGAVDAQHPPTWTLHPQLKLPAVATDTDGTELCHRHRLITDNQDWPPVVDHKTSSVTAQRQLHQLPDGPVLELARKFGELGVAPVPEFLLKDGELQRCSCQSVLGSAGIRQGEDPTETSDALLVLEGLGSEEVNGLGINACQKTESQNAEPGAFALKCFPSVVSGGLCSPACCLLRDSVNTRPQAPASDKLTPEVPSQAEPSQGTPCSSQASTPKSRPDRSATRAQLSAASGGEKTLKVPGKSRKGSLKIRLSKLFRTKSCSGSNNILDKRPSVTFSISSAGSLVDMSGPSGGEQDTASQPGLTRAQSAFSAASFTSVFTGETVSLVDVDISQRGRNSPHPPTPPPPPRRSLSLLDAFFRALPHSVQSQMETPAPARVAPPPIMCPLRGADSSSFTASLRELEEFKLLCMPYDCSSQCMVTDSANHIILDFCFNSSGTFSLWCHPKFEDRCHSVVEFIERAIMHSKNGKFLYFLRSRVPGLPPTPVQLLYPVSRFSNVKSLQHLCRFCIRQLVRIDHIQELPLPKPLIVYLRKFYYYDPEEEMYLSIKGMRQAAGVEQEAESET
uniref:Suppressor of cytokine signaling 7 n=1 Tax=Cyprinus carpio TaxID=7962 RepID=A0A8C2IUU8_CYPCA